MKKKISGVYKITNTITGDSYIGSSKNIKRRWRDHKNSAEWRRHPNSRLYQDIAELGRDSFTIEVIEETDQLKEREQYWIETLRPSYNSNRASGWDIERHLANNKTYYNRLCAYGKEVITLGALTQRFYRQGILCPTVKAKKYLITNEQRG